MMAMFQHKYVIRNSKRNIKYDKFYNNLELFDKL